MSVTAKRKMLEDFAEGMFILHEDFDSLTHIAIWINASVLALAFTENENQRRKGLEIMLFTKDGNGLDVEVNLKAHFEQLLLDLNDISFDSAVQTQKSLAPLVHQYISAIQIFREGKDNGESLHKLAQSNPLTAAIAEMKNSFRKSGRRKKASEQVMRETAVTAMLALEENGLNRDEALDEYLNQLRSSDSDLDTAILAKLDESRDQFSLISQWITRHKPK